MGLPHDQSDRIHAGERPLQVWREHRGLEVTDLRRATHSYLVAAGPSLP